MLTLPQNGENRISKDLKFGSRLTLNPLSKILGSAPGCIMHVDLAVIGVYCELK